MPLQKNDDAVLSSHNPDGIDRRGFLKCMAWAGTDALCVLEGGVVKSYGIDNAFGIQKAAQGALSFVQISDSHIWVNKPADSEVILTLKHAALPIHSLPFAPD